MVNMCYNGPTDHTNKAIEEPVARGAGVEKEGEEKVVINEE